MKLIINNRSYVDFNRTGYYKILTTDYPRILDYDYCNYIVIMKR